MRQFEVVTPSTCTRRVFPSWSIDIPTAFEEAFAEEGAYWHAWDAHRSVSLTSVQLDDDAGPVRAQEIVGRMPVLDGEPFAELPPGVVGIATVIAAEQPARASRTLSGLLAVDGCVLVVTITSDDLEWARQTWLSIRPRPVWPPRNRASRRAERNRSRLH